MAAQVAVEQTVAEAVPYTRSGTLASAVRCSKSPRYSADRVARVGRLQPPVHSQRLDGGEDRIGPALGDEDGDAALTARRAARRRSRPGRRRERSSANCALGLLDRRVPVVGLAGVQARQPGRDLRGDPPADRGEEAVRRSVSFPTPNGVVALRRVDSARTGGGRWERANRGGRTRCSCGTTAARRTMPPARAAPLAVLRAARPRGSSAAAMPARRRRSRRHAATWRGSMRSGGVVGQQAGQVAACRAPRSPSRPARSSPRSRRARAPCSSGPRTRGRRTRRCSSARSCTRRLRDRARCRRACR